MERILNLFREYPAMAGMAVFVAICALVGSFFVVMMQRAGVSVRPLVFVFGFIAIVGVPQASVHLLDALAHMRAQSSVEKRSGSDGGAGRIQPVGWERVFGAEADPALITDAKLGLGVVVGAAEEAKISFRNTGETALAARFASEAAARQALDGYGNFFRFAQVSGSDAEGWTGRRFEGQGEWNHVVVAGNELYAWTGPSKERVEARRVAALGPLEGVGELSKTAVSAGLTKNVPLMSAFVAINLILAVGWFFKGSAWATQQRPEAGVAPLVESDLRWRLEQLGADASAMLVRQTGDGLLDVSWRYGEARWIDMMRIHNVKRATKLTLQFDEAARVVRVREYWSAFDASAGLDGARFEWTAATGMQFFQFESKKVFGAQLEADGRPTGELSATLSFDLQALKGPVVETVLASGWTWKPVVWTAPDSLRWLTE